MLTKKYVKEAVTNVEEDLNRNGKRLKSKCFTPLSINYAPWMKYYPELMAYIVKRSQELIGQIRWAYRLDV